MPDRPATPPLTRTLRTAARKTADPLVRAWLRHLLSGESATGADRRPTDDEDRAVAARRDVTTR